MGVLTISSKEKELQRKYFEERVRLHGTSVKYLHIIKSSASSFNDISVDQYEERVIDIMINETPSPKLLKSLNWFNGYEDNLPMIIEVPLFYESKDIELIEGDRIQLEYGIKGGFTEWKVSSVSYDSPAGIYYVAKLVPWYSDKNHTVPPQVDLTDKSDVLNVEKKNNQILRR